MSGERLSETRIAGLHLPLALLLFAIGVGSLLVEGPRAFSMLRAAFPMALGGFVVLIVGTSRMLVSGTAGIPVAARRAWWVPGTLVAAGSLGLWLAFGGQPRLLTPSAGLWGLGVGSHVAVLGYSLARGRTQAAFTQGWPVGLTTIAALGYGLASAVALPMVAVGRLSLFAALHLVLAGFLVLVVAAVVLEVLPRFSGVGLPDAWGGVMAIALALGPALLAEGMDGAALLLQAGAVVEGLGLILLGAALTWSVLRSERARDAFLLYAIAGVTLLVGAVVGAGLALGMLDHRLAAWHGCLNLLGFVGLVVLGAVIDLFAPSLAPGAKRLAQHNRVVVVLALVGVAGLLAMPWIGGILVRIALGAYLAALLLHFAGSIVRLQP